MHSNVRADIFDLFYFLRDFYYFVRLDMVFVVSWITVLALMLLNLSVFVLADVRPNLNQMHETAESALHKWRIARDTGQTETPIVATSKKQAPDDRLYFELPKWFQRANTTEAMARTVSTPLRLNINIDDTATSKLCRTIAVNGDYSFR